MAYADINLVLILQEKSRHVPFAKNQNILGMVLLFILTDFIRYQILRYFFVY